MHAALTQPAALRSQASVSHIRAAKRRPSIPSGVRFALIGRPHRWLETPTVFNSAAALAAAIHTARGSAGLQLADAPLRLLGQDESRPGVSVWTLGEDGQRHRYLGWVWLDGGDRHALQAALFALAPIVAFADAA